MLLGSLQENLITILCYDTQHAPIIRGVVDPSLFGGPYRTLVARIYDHLDRFKKPPGDHLPDLLSDKLESDNKREGTLYTDIIESIHAAKDSINAAYVMAQLETFIKRQSLRGIAVDLAKALQRDTEDSLLEAENLLAKANHQTLSVFDPGTRLSNKTKSLEFLDIASTALPTGIPELDRRGFGPSRKELWLGIANSGAGKTWLLIQLAKMALLHRVKVVHITLEMSEARCSQRYFQAFFAMAKRKDAFQTTKFQKDKLGRLTGFDDVRITPKLSLEDPNIRKKLERRIDRGASRIFDHIIVKQFPSGALTVPQLKAYLDNLETSERFTPDLIIVDYPDLMSLDKANYRLSLDETFKDLRGIAVSRNAAMAVVSQSHRAAAKAKQVGADNVAEAYSKVAHSDVIVTLSATKQEQALGLARLFLAKGRNDEDKFTVVISQQYKSGSFVVDSAMMSSTYWGNIPKPQEGEDE